MPKKRPILQLGSHDTATDHSVSELQTLLGIPQTGVFDRTTNALVHAFQMKHALNATGIVDPATWEALDQSYAQSHPQPGLPGLPTRRPSSHATVTTPTQPPVIPGMPSRKPHSRPHAKPHLAGEPQDLGATLLSLASAELGHGETTRDNYGPDVRHYKTVTHHTGNGGPWCADFVSYIFHQAAPGLIRPTSLAKGVMKQFKHLHAFQKITSDYQPQPGDVVFFDRRFSHGPSSHMKGHIGFLVGIDPDGTMHTIEANKAAPQFVGMEEGRDYEWSAEFPDLVRNVTYTAQEYKEAKILGYGSIAQIVHNSPLYRHAASLSEQSSTVTKMQQDSSAPGSPPLHPSGIPPQPGRAQHMAGK